MRCVIGFGTALLVSAGAAVAQNHYYATNGVAPWGHNSNEGAMDMVFGKGNWIQGNYNTWNAKDVFSDNTDCVFLEGGDQDSLDLAKFIAGNHTLMEDWVADGHGLFINAAPNVGGDFDMGFGGVTLDYLGGQVDHLDAIDPNHPIWNGPFTPAGTFWDGTGTHHAGIIGGGTTPLAVDANGNFPLAELKWGNGLVLFGGLTTDQWWTLQPNAHNARANMIDYMCRVPAPSAAGLLGMAGLAAARRRR